MANIHVLYLRLRSYKGRNISHICVLTLNICYSPPRSFLFIKGRRKSDVNYDFSRMWLAENLKNPQKKKECILKTIRSPCSSGIEIEFIEDNLLTIVLYIFVLFSCCKLHFIL